MLATVSIKMYVISFGKAWARNLSHGELEEGYSISGLWWFGYYVHAVAKCCHVGESGVEFAPI